MKPTKAQQCMLAMLQNGHQLCIVDMGTGYCSAYIQSQYYLHMTEQVNVATAKALVNHGLVRLLHYSEEMGRHTFVLAETPKEADRENG